ncbi:hormogonium polysaccharide secretion pseudopilin HpsC [Limnoraphis robusta Tam1]|uniref:hormogonium polysaccharide secretion pseudopilin HpsC n=1 Tax=Limnoraphis robusta TaxID=1118279 RepID=UPI002B1F3771|nr:hormogonium polysaccharide secretion pseudopilin HpsC [Limnoraphis robusta]MEA5540236.1 hormogonium polysaccharide secretion pseudopilin HpsC [Limnoraphis robusta Tam1]
MNNLLRSLLKIPNRTRKKQGQSVSGFTMIELMVGAILAFLIITPMLGFVISILEDDNREGLKAITDQEVNSAVDYIAEDLNQARYIYDKDGLTKIQAELPTVDNGTPILVFWKRHLLTNSLPFNSKTQPKDCNDTTKPCNDAYVDALVAYYLVTNNQSNIWCNPTSNAGQCPARIVRAEIRGALRNPRTGNEYPVADLNDSQKKTLGFQALQDDPKTWKKDPNTAYPANLAEVLVNYIDHNTVALPGDATNEYCVNALGGELTNLVTGDKKNDNILKIKTDSNSFVACVDSDRNIAHVAIRGNALRRKDADAPYNANKSSFFPTATVKVQGQSTPISSGS